MEQTILKRVPWNKGKRGVMPTPWNKGLHIRNNNCLSEYREKYIKEYDGHLPPEHKKAISSSLTGLSMSHKGKPWTEARRSAQKVKAKKPVVKNGKSYDGEWVEIRAAVYKRDNWTCQECGVKCHGNGNKDKIQCHHIDYKTDNNKTNNLITLCVSCHAKTNYRRTDWTNHYKKKVRQ